ncbi:MAG: FeoB-associated Cys-rich membrane protein [Ruminococcaceae bacterium]|nr:FeoB-associated Cys-rich membrane protein [Oscillospiraceae bacterium]
MQNIIIIIILALILGGALWYIIRSKKNGNKCIGCPYGKMCQSGKNNNAPCSCQKSDN